MSNLGVGVMLGILGGNADSAKAFSGAIDKEIARLELIKDDYQDELFFTFTDGSRIKLYDGGQSCCEKRYMTTDDDLGYYIGAKLHSAEVRDAPEREDEWGVHEVQFLFVETSKGTFTMETHNKHNGYYGGFLVRAAIVEYPDAADSLCCDNTG